MPIKKKSVLFNYPRATRVNIKSVLLKANKSLPKGIIVLENDR
jgi:hypothetical protein